MIASKRGVIGTPRRRRWQTRPNATESEQRDRQVVAATGSHQPAPIAAHVVPSTAPITRTSLALTAAPRA